MGSRNQTEEASGWWHVGKCAYLLSRLPHLPSSSLYSYKTLLGFIYFMWMTVLSAYMLVYYMHVWCCWTQRRGLLDPLELKLQMAVSHHVGAGHQTQVSTRTSSTLNHWVISSFPLLTPLFSEIVSHWPCSLLFWLEGWLVNHPVVTRNVGYRRTSMLSFYTGAGILNQSVCLDSRHFTY